MTSAVLDMPDVDYHALPSLSASGAKVLLDCPAKYRWLRDQPEQHADHFDLGHAAHTLVLGTGRPIRVVEAETWQTKAAKAEQADAYACGETPLKRKDFERVVAMAETLLTDRIAAPFLAHGQAETSLFWTDAGVPMRARLDWWHPQPCIVDIKTTTDASPGGFARSVARYRYHLQAAIYRAGAKAVFDLDDEPPFVLIAQETEPPYLVGVYELDTEALDVGRRLMRRAIALWRECTDTDTWPGYAPAVLTLPRWATWEGE